MNEHLQLHRTFFTNCSDFPQRHFSGQHYTGSSHICPGVYGDPVGIVGLGADVDVRIWSIFFCKGKNPQIGYKHGIYPYLIKVRQILRQLFHITVMRKDIYGDIYLSPQLVGKVHSLLQLIIIKVASKGPKPKGLASQIHRIGTIYKGHLKFFHITGGRQ